jgi:hypothetical protein
MKINLTITGSIILRMINVADKNRREKKGKHILRSIIFFRKIFLYKIMWKNVVQPD